MSELSEAVKREKIHERRIIGEGFQREDGLWDIEGRLTDEKTYPFENEYRGRIEPGDLIHRMGLRMTLDDDFVIRRVEAMMSHHPFAVCPEILGAFRRLEGLAVKPGWSRAMRDRVGGVQGCTHLVTLLDNLAIVAFQTIAPLKRKDPATASHGKPRHIDSCHALRSDGPVVKEHYPRWCKHPGQTPS